MFFSFRGIKNNKKKLLTLLPIQYSINMGNKYNKALFLLAGKKKKIVQCPPQEIEEGPQSNS